MMEAEELYEIELVTFGCCLSMLSHDDELSISNILPSQRFDVEVFRRHYGCISDEVYTEACIDLFNNTREKFDWEKLMSHSTAMSRGGGEGGGSASTTPQFTGDPLDLQFMKFARKMNEIILTQKSPTYKDSWRKRGLVGIYHNLCRKWDRIENIIEGNDDGRELNPQCIANDGMALVDAIADLFAYCGKTMTYLEYMDIYADAVTDWEEKNGVGDIK